MRLKILTPDKLVFEGNVQQVTLPGSLGKVQILKDHAPFVSTLQEGTIICKDGPKEDKFAVHAGFAEVLNNNITVLVGAATSC